MQNIFIGQCDNSMDFSRNTGDFSQIKKNREKFFKRRVQHRSIFYDNILSKWCENTKHFKVRAQLIRLMNIFFGIGQELRWKKLQENALKIESMIKRNEW